MITFGERTANPGTPASGYMRLFVKNDNRMYATDDAGTTFEVDSRLLGFSATASGQSVSNAVITKISLSTEVFDNFGDYDHTTNFRHTPGVAGFYHYHVQVSWTAMNPTKQILAAVYKNGSLYKRQDRWTGNTTTVPSVQCDAYIQMNGTTDYVEFYCYQGDSFSQVLSTSSYCQAYGYRVATL